MQKPDVSSNSEPVATGTDLSANEQVGDAGCVLLQLGDPLLPHILETGRVYHREADEEDIGHRVGQRPQPVVVLLQTDGTAAGQVNVWDEGGRGKTNSIISVLSHLLNYYS